MDKKQIIRLNENQIKRVVMESVKKVLNEEFGVDFENTLNWVKKKYPNMPKDEQEKFAINIINKKKREKDEKEALEDTSKHDAKWDAAFEKISKYWQNADCGVTLQYDKYYEFIVPEKKQWVYDILNKLPAQEKRRIWFHKGGHPEDVVDKVTNVHIQHGDTKGTFVCYAGKSVYELVTKPYLNGNQYIIMRRRPYSG